MNGHPPLCLLQLSSRRSVVSASGIQGGHVSIFTVFFIVLLVAWLLGVGVFHIAGGLIHILLVLAAVSLILHFVRGARTA
jgi:uncharacterized protein DUF5670